MYVLTVLDKIIFLIILIASFDNLVRVRLYRDKDMSQELKSKSHSLVEIPPRDWNILLDLYSEKRSEPTGYNTINNFIQWIKKEPDMELKCFSLDGEWLSDGTFIIMVIKHS